MLVFMSSATGIVGTYVIYTHSGRHRLKPTFCSIAKPAPGNRATGNTRSRINDQEPEPVSCLGHIGFIDRALVLHIGHPKSLKQQWFYKKPDWATEHPG